MGISNEESRRRLMKGREDPAYRQTNEYKEAAKHSLAHYKGMLSGSNDQQDMRDEQTRKEGSKLWKWFKGK